MADPEPTGVLGDDRGNVYLKQPAQEQLLRARLADADHARSVWIENAGLREEIARVKGQHAEDVARLRGEHLEALAHASGQRETSRITTAVSLSLMGFSSLIFSIATLVWATQLGLALALLALGTIFVLGSVATAAVGQATDKHVSPIPITEPKREALKVLVDANNPDVKRIGRLLALMDHLENMNLPPTGPNKRHED